MRTPRRTLLPVLPLLVAMLCVLWAGPATAGNRAERQGQKLLGFVNDVRADRGVKPLRQLSGLSDIARAHTRAMVRQGRLFHTQDLAKKVSSWSPVRWGENVGYGPSVWRVVKMWQRSPSHYANMIGRGFHRAGVAVIYAKGWYWATLIVIS